MQFKREKFKYNLSISTTLKNIHAWNSSGRGNSIQGMHSLQSVLKCGQFATKLYSHLSTKLVYTAGILNLLEAVGYQQWSLPQITIAAALKIQPSSKAFVCSQYKGGFVGKCWSTTQQPAKYIDSKCNQHTGFQDLYM